MREERVPASDYAFAGGELLTFALARRDRGFAICTVLTVVPHRPPVTSLRHVRPCVGVIDEFGRSVPVFDFRSFFGLDGVIGPSTGIAVVQVMVRGRPSLLAGLVVDGGREIAGNTSGRIDLESYLRPARLNAQLRLLVELDPAVIAAAHSAAA